MSLATFQSVAARFRDDLISLLKSERVEVPDLSNVDVGNGVRDALLAYLRVRFRSISQRKRVVHRSSDLDQRQLDSIVSSALNQIQGEFETGNASHLNQRLTRDHYDSAFNDRLLNDLGITHLHLGSLGTTVDHTGNHPMAKSGKDTLFAYLDKDTAYFLDVRDHLPSFRQDNHYFLDLIQRNWPNLLEQYKSPGVTQTTPNHSSEGRYELRKVGVVAPIELKGVVYHPPGGGFMSDGTNIEVVRIANQILNDAYENIDKVELEHGSSCLFSLSVTGNTISFKAEADGLTGEIDYPLDW